MPAQIQEQKPVILSADSAADLPADIAERHGIVTIPIYVNLMGQSLRDGIDVTTRDIFAAFRGRGEIPTTSAIPIGEYEALFARLTRGGACAAVHWCISSGISSCYQNAAIAAREFEDVYVIDSESITIGLAMQLLHAARLRENGAAAAEIAEEARRFRGQVRLTALLGSVDYMRKGGRCSAVSALGANLLGIRPMLQFEESKLGVHKKLRGKTQAVREQFIAEQFEAPETIDPSIALLYHSGLSEEEFSALVAQVEDRAVFQELRTGSAGAVISSHCGEGSVYMAHVIK
ncbi:MAG: DegV family protein [Oscillospiraceae bacterium]|nr:DegV family protein [Oscillospiraceae bacterium]